MATAILFLSIFCAIVFYKLYREEERLNRRLESLYRNKSMEYLKFVRKSRDTVYYDPYNNEIITCDRLIPIGRVENESE